MGHAVGISPQILSFLYLWTRNTPHPRYEIFKPFRILDFLNIFQTQQLIFCFFRHISEEYNYAGRWIRPRMLDLQRFVKGFEQRCPCAFSKHNAIKVYRGADKSLPRPTSRCILFNGKNILFDASLVLYIYIHIYTRIVLIFLQLWL